MGSLTILTNESDILKIRECGKIIRDIFIWCNRVIKEGISTAYLDAKIEEMILEKGATPAFKGYRGYPATICASINEVIVHGIPSEEIVLREGDIIGLDVGVKKNGFYTDAARTFTVGRIDSETKQLIDVTQECLRKGIEQAVSGNRISDISYAIQTVAKEAGYQEVRAFVGHGIGRKLHEAPEVPNYGEKGYGPVMKTGLLLAIEPMINQGTREVCILPDGWTAVTKDKKLSAHFENTVMVCPKKAEIMT
ncbi:MAG: type I methionyl aminopeptidase [Candidatus Omnitrophota bacterium]